MQRCCIACCVCPAWLGAGRPALHWSCLANMCRPWFELQAGWGMARCASDLHRRLAALYRGTDMTNSISAGPLILVPQLCLMHPLTQSGYHVSKVLPLTMHKIQQRLLGAELREQPLAKWWA